MILTKRNTRNNSNTSNIKYSSINKNEILNSAYSTWLKSPEDILHCLESSSNSVSPTQSILPPFFRLLQKNTINKDYINQPFTDIESNTSYSKRQAIISPRNLKNQLLPLRILKLERSLSSDFVFHRNIDFKTISNKDEDMFKKYTERSISDNERNKNIIFRKKKTYPYDFMTLSQYCSVGHHFLMYPKNEITNKYLDVYMSSSADFVNTGKQNKFNYSNKINLTNKHKSYNDSGSKISTFQIYEKPKKYNNYNRTLNHNKYNSPVSFTKTPYICSNYIKTLPNSAKSKKSEQILDNDTMNISSNKTGKMTDSYTSKSQTIKSNISANKFAGSVNSSPISSNYKKSDLLQQSYNKGSKRSAQFSFSRKTRKKKNYKSFLLEGKQTIDILPISKSRDKFYTYKLKFNYLEISQKRCDDNYNEYPLCSSEYPSKFGYFCGSENEDSYEKNNHKSSILPTANRNFSTSTKNSIKNYSKQVHAKINYKLSSDKKFIENYTNTDNSILRIKRFLVDKLRQEKKIVYPSLIKQELAKIPLKNSSLSADSLVSAKTKGQRYTERELRILLNDISQQSKFNIPKDYLPLKNIKQYGIQFATVLGPNYQNALNSCHESSVIQTAIICDFDETLAISSVHKSSRGSFLINIPVKPCYFRAVALVVDKEEALGVLSGNSAGGGKSVPICFSVETAYKKILQLRLSPKTTLINKKNSIPTPENISTTWIILITKTLKRNGINIVEDKNNIYLSSCFLSIPPSAIYQVWSGTQLTYHRSNHSSIIKAAINLEEKVKIPLVHFFCPKRWVNSELMERLIHRRELTYKFYNRTVLPLSDSTRDPEVIYIDQRKKYLPSLGSKESVSMRRLEVTRNFDDLEKYNNKSSINKYSWRSNNTESFLTDGQRNILNLIGNLNKSIKTMKDSINHLLYSVTLELWNETKELLKEHTNFDNHVFGIESIPKNLFLIVVVSIIIVHSKRRSSWLKAIMKDPTISDIAAKDCTIISETDLHFICSALVDVITLSTPWVCYSEYQSDKIINDLLVNDSIKNCFETIWLTSIELHEHEYNNSIWKFLFCLRSLFSESILNSPSEDLEEFNTLAFTALVGTTISIHSFPKVISCWRDLPCSYKVLYPEDNELIKAYQNSILSDETCFTFNIDISSDTLNECLNIENQQFPLKNISTTQLELQKKQIMIRNYSLLINQKKKINTVYYLNYIRNILLNPTLNHIKTKRLLALKYILGLHYIIKLQMGALIHNLSILADFKEPQNGQNNIYKILPEVYQKSNQLNTGPLLLNSIVKLSSVIGDILNNVKEIERLSTNFSYFLFQANKAISSLSSLDIYKNINYINQIEQLYTCSNKFLKLSIQENCDTRISKEPTLNETVLQSERLDHGTYKIVSNADSQITELQKALSLTEIPEFIQKISNTIDNLKICRITGLLRDELQDKSINSEKSNILSDDIQINDDQFYSDLKSLKISDSSEFFSIENGIPSNKSSSLQNTFYDKDLKKDRRFKSNIYESICDSYNDKNLIYNQNFSKFNKSKDKVTGSNLNPIYERKKFISQLKYGYKHKAKNIHMEFKKLVRDILQPILYETEKDISYLCDSNNIYFDYDTYKNAVIAIATYAYEEINKCETDKKLELQWLREESMTLIKIFLEDKLGTNSINIQQDISLSTMQSTVDNYRPSGKLYTTEQISQIYNSTDYNIFFNDDSTRYRDIPTTSSNGNLVQRENNDRNSSKNFINLDSLNSIINSLDSSTLQKETNMNLQNNLNDCIFRDILVISTNIYELLRVRSLCGCEHPSDKAIRTLENLNLYINESEIIHTSNCDTNKAIREELKVINKVWNFPVIIDSSEFCSAEKNSLFSTILLNSKITLSEIFGLLLAIKFATWNIDRDIILILLKSLGFNYFLMDNLITILKSEIDIGLIAAPCYFYPLPGKIGVKLYNDVNLTSTVYPLISSYNIDDINALIREDIISLEDIITESGETLCDIDQQWQSKWNTVPQEKLMKMTKHSIDLTKTIESVSLNGSNFTENKKCQTIADILNCNPKK